MQLDKYFLYFLVFIFSTVCLVLGYNTLQNGIVKARQEEYLTLAINKYLGAINHYDNIFKQEFFEKGPSKTSDLFCVLFNNKYAETTTPLRSTGKKERLYNLSHPGHVFQTSDIVVSDFRNKYVVRGIYYSFLNNKPVAFIRQKELSEILWDNSSSVFLTFITPLMLIILVIVITSRDKMLRKSKARLNDIMELVNRALLLTDTDGDNKLISVNQRLCQVSGFKEHELLGKDHTILNRGHHNWLDEMFETTALGGIWNDIIENTTKDGIKFKVDKFVKKKSYEPGYISIKFDVTNILNDQELLRIKSDEVEEHFNRQSAILDNLTDGVITIDNKGIITYANKAATEIFEYSIEELLGNNVNMLMPEFYHSEHDSYLKRYNDTQSPVILGVERRHVFGRNKSGQFFDISLAVEKVGDNEFVGSLQDISEQVADQNDIKNKNDQLNTVSFIVRHDLIGAVGYVARGVKSLQRKLTPDQIKDLKLTTAIYLIQQGYEQQIKVLEGLRNWTDVIRDNKNVVKEDFKANDILLSHFKTTSYYDNIELQDLGVVNGEKNLFISVIANLVRNSIKYNNKDKKLVQIYRENNCLYVKDNGNGFDSNTFDRLCKPFQRGSSSKSGSGIGLSIVSAIVKLHNWKMTAESVIDEGTIIKIEMS